MLNFKVSNWQVARKSNVLNAKERFITDGNFTKQALITVTGRH